MGGDVGVGGWDGEKFFEFALGIKVAVLKTSTGDQLVRALLPEVLEFGGIHVEVVAVIEGQDERIELGRCDGGIVIKNALRGVGVGECVLECAEQEESVMLRAPFVMPTADQERFLSFFATQAGDEVVLIVVLPEI